MTVRVVFLGNDPWSVAPLEALAEDGELEVGLVATNPPRPAGRGSRPRPTAVARSAEELGLPLAEVGGLRDGDGPNALRAAGPDVLVVVAYGEILTPDVLAIAPLGAVNLHFSLLPRWRGAAPVRRTLLAGDAVTGVTAMLMDEGLDTGPILAVAEETVRPDDDAGTLGTRLAGIGGPLLVRAVRSLAFGTATPRPQDPALATTAPKLAPEERWIAWDEPAPALIRRVRALAPEPGASTRLRGNILKVFRAEPAGALDDRGHGGDASVGAGASPGAILAVDRAGVVVATGSGAVRLLDVASAGRRRMPAVEWARGARVSIGEPLG